MPSSRPRGPANQLARRRASLALAATHWFVDQVTGCGGASATPPTQKGDGGITQSLVLALVQAKPDVDALGLDNVAAAIGKESGTIEDVIEPYLIQLGYLQRTPRGRIATLAAYRHLGTTPPQAADDLY